MRRRATALLALALLTGCGGGDGHPVRLDGLGVERAVADFVAVQQDDGRRAYEQPSADQAQQLADAVLALGEGRRQEAERRAAGISYAVVELDGWLALAPARLPDDRGWGLYVVRPGGVELALEVPHPRADLETEHLGAALAREVGARYLLVAGAHRDAADEQADVAREEGSAFTVVHRALAERGVPALQLHGYAESSLPGVDVVVSPGAADLSDLARRTADRAAADGLRVCRAWQETCGRLEGRRNAQGRASSATGTTFVHLELTRDLRRHDRRAQVVDVLSRAAQP